LEDQEPPKPKKHHLKSHDLSQVKSVLKKIRKNYKAPELSEDDKIDPI
jgi:hypothetical protein